tara:strand:- start:739 stop:972 length:234 start_codon:yes stop_codon:yes gene_type:complete
MQFDSITKENTENKYDNQTSNFSREPLPRSSNECPHCKNTGIVKEQDGSVHTCWKCLEEGKLDVHSSNLPDNDDIKL